MTRKIHKLAFQALLGLLLLFSARAASAGPYGDTLGKCLVSSTTSTEKTTLVRWMFAMMALHPDVQSSSSITPEQRAQLTKETAQLFQRLLIESCRNETREAIKYEGEATIQTSFSLLGQVAARELFLNPKVSGGLSELEKYIDGKKLKELFESSQQP
jgi:hypothetical protein